MVSGAFKAFVRFGAKIFVSPKTQAQLNNPGFKLEFNTESVIIPIEVEGETGYVAMSKKAWDSLIAGKEAIILTTEEYRKKYKVKV
ncbi:MAG TPA: hypothetical protein PLP81_08105 [Saprospiraceae bacterium]|nr:hypothetical protein [Saprospiraceae bacterium]HNG68629.1 hypothetical protein [Saprospiraceae bacterium]